MLISFLIVLHLVASIFLILIVLLQTGKGQDLASAFGGGGAQAVFGSSGAATILHKLTVASAIIFMLTSLILSIFGAAPSASVVSDSVIPPQKVENPLKQPVTSQDQGNNDVAPPAQQKQDNSSTEDPGSK